MIKVLVMVGLLTTIACSKEKKERVDPVDPDQQKVEQLKAAYDDMLSAAFDLRDQDTGWLDHDGCDGMIWAGRYAAAPGVIDVDILAAERDGNGSFDRRPTRPCWTEEDGDQGSKTTWSRDMAVCGLFPWAWKHQRLDVLERHAAYGKANNWKMGEPLDDGRTVYTPAMIGLLYQMIFALGGEDSVNRIWPDIYTKGLEDYQAHLQVCSIWLRGDIAARHGDADAMPKKPEDGAALTSISDKMFDRLQDHHTRVPGDPFYAYAYGLYNGDMGPALDACLAGTAGGYARCTAKEECVLAHRIFACGLTLEHLGAL